MDCLVLVAMNRANKTGPLRARFSSPAWGRRTIPSRGEQLPAVVAEPGRNAAITCPQHDMSMQATTVAHNRATDMPAMQEWSEYCVTDCARMRAAQQAAPEHSCGD